MDMICLYFTRVFIMPVTTKKNSILLFSLSKEEEKEEEERNRSGGYKDLLLPPLTCFSRERYFSLSFFLSPGDERVRSQSAFLCGKISPLLFFLLKSL
jgi:hypothetical protein